VFLGPLLYRLLYASGAGAFLHRPEDVRGSTGFPPLTRPPLPPDVVNTRPCSSHSETSLSRSAACADRCWVRATTSRSSARCRPPSSAPARS